MSASVREYVCGALAQQAGLAPDSAALCDMKFYATGLDSLDLMELLNEVEEQFNIRINDDTVTAETTVGEFIAFVESKVAEAAG